MLNSRLLRTVVPRFAVASAYSSSTATASATAAAAPLGVGVGGIVGGRGGGCGVRDDCQQRRFITTSHDAKHSDVLTKNTTNAANQHQDYPFTETVRFELRMKKLMSR